MAMTASSMKGRKLVAVNLAGLAILAACHPHLRFSATPAVDWFGYLGSALAAAAVLYGLYYLAAKDRARNGWPRGFFMLAWFVLGASVISPLQQREDARAAARVQAPAQPTITQAEWEKGTISLPAPN